MLSTKYKIAKFITYGILAIVLCVVQNTPGLLLLWGTKPMLVVSFAVCVTMFERETAGGLFGAFSGLLCDLFSPYTFGYYGLALFICCVLVGLLSQSYVTPMAVNALLLALATIFAIQWSGFFFTILIMDIPDSMRYFTGRILPLCAYTGVTAIPFYYLAGKLHRYFQRLIETA